MEIGQESLERFLCACRLEKLIEYLFRLRVTTEPGEDLGPICVAKRDDETICRPVKLNGLLVVCQRAGKLLLVHQESAELDMRIRLCRLTLALLSQLEFLVQSLSCRCVLTLAAGPAADMSQRKARES